MNDTRERRAAENENLFRRVNERVEELSRGLEELALVCECADAACVQRLPRVPVTVYEDVRAHGTRFVVAPGHERRDVETVVDERRGYIVVEKRGPAGEVAREGDPRSA
jgi:hypothetical protein